MVCSAGMDKEEGPDGSLPLACGTFHISENLASWSGILGNLCLLCGDDLILRGRTQLVLENKNGLHQLVDGLGTKMTALV